MTSFQKLVDRSQVNRSRIKSLVDDYQSMLRLLSYAKSPNQADMVVYSYAPIGEAQLEALQKRYFVADDNSVESIIVISNHVLAYSLAHRQIVAYLEAYRTIANSGGRIEPHDDIIAFMLLNQQVVASSNPSKHFVNTKHPEMPVLERAIVPYKVFEPELKLSAPNFGLQFELSPLEQRLFMSAVRLFMVERAFYLARLDGLMPLTLEFVVHESFDHDHQAPLANEFVENQTDMQEAPQTAPLDALSGHSKQEAEDNTSINWKCILGAMIGGAFVGGAAYTIATDTFLTFFTTGVLGPVIGVAAALALAYVIVGAIQDALISKCGPTLLQNDNEYPSFSI